MSYSSAEVQLVRRAAPAESATLLHEFHVERESLTRNFEPNPSFNPQKQIVLIPFTMAGYKRYAIDSYPLYLPLVGNEPATSR